MLGIHQLANPGLPDSPTPYSSKRRFMTTYLPLYSCSYAKTPELYVSWHGIASKRAHAPSSHYHLLRATHPFSSLLLNQHQSKRSSELCLPKPAIRCTECLGDKSGALQKPRNRAVRTEWPYYRLRDGDSAKNGDIFTAPLRSLKFQLRAGCAEQVALLGSY